MADAVVYRSRVQIERVRGPLRRAHLPVEPDPVLFGVHSEVAAHYYPRPAVPGVLGRRPWRRAGHRTPGVETASGRRTTDGRSGCRRGGR